MLYPEVDNYIGGFMGTGKTIWAMFSIIAAMSAMPSLSWGQAATPGNSSNSIIGGPSCGEGYQPSRSASPPSLQCPSGQTAFWNHNTCGYFADCQTDPCQALSDKYDTAANSAGDKTNTLQDTTQSKLDKLQNSYNTTKADNDQKLQDILQKINDADAKHNEAIAKNTDAASKAAIDAQTNSDKLTLDLKKMNADLSSAQGAVTTANANVSVVAAANSIDMIRLQCLAQVQTGKNNTTTISGGSGAQAAQQSKLQAVWNACLVAGATKAQAAIQAAQQAVIDAQGKISVLQGQIAAQTNAIALASQSAAASKNSLSTTQANELKQYNQNRAMLVQQYQTSSQNAQSSLQTIMSQENTTSMNAAQQAQNNPVNKQLTSITKQMQNSCCGTDGGDTAYTDTSACTDKGAQNDISSAMTQQLTNAGVQAILGAH